MTMPTDRRPLQNPPGSCRLGAVQFWQIVPFQWLRLGAKNCRLVRFDPAISFIRHAMTDAAGSNLVGTIAAPLVPARSKRSKPMPIFRHESSVTNLRHHFSGFPVSVAPAAGPDFYETSLMAISFPLRSASVANQRLAEHRAKKKSRPDSGLRSRSCGDPRPTTDWAIKQHGRGVRARFWRTLYVLALF